MNLTFALEIIKKSIRKTALLLALAAALSGCLGTKYLQENEKLLYRQTIVAPKGYSAKPLTSLYVQKVNGKFFGLRISPSAWIYHVGKNRFKPEKILAQKDKIESKFDRKINKSSNPKKRDNLQFRKKKKLDALDSKIENGNNFMQWGEPISIFDSAKMVATVDRINSYFLTKGYFRGMASASFTETKKRVSVVYDVKPGKAYFIDTLLYAVPDTVVLKLVKKNNEKSLIKLKDQFDQDKLTKERERIDFLLKDNGYYDFSRQYIDFQLDTLTRRNYHIILKLDIRNPGKSDHHKQFRIDSLNFTPDAGVKSDLKKRTSHPYENIIFNYYRSEFSKRILAQRVFIAKDSLYSRTKTFSTQRQMANLDMFKFVNINYDTSGGRFIANIFASPQDRYAWSNEAGVTVTQGFPGPYISTSFKKRNLLGGLEILELNGRFGFEGVASATETGNFYQSTEAIGSASVTFPQFLFPFSRAASFRYAKYNPRTRLSSSYTYTDRPEYKRSITALAATYTWDINQRLQFAFTPTNLNIIRSSLDSAFTSRLDTLAKQGNNLIRAFKPSFVGSMILSVTWNNNYGSNQKNSFMLRGTIESGGTLLNLYTPQIIINQGLEPYQYIRLSLDFRRNIFINKNTSLAYRINTGFGYAYSSNRVLPYEKNFFVGGSNSVRAWRPRRLGVGSDTPPLNANPEKSGYYDYRFEKPGEFLIEGSVEWRQKLFAFINYALFIDAGNVWALRSDIDKPTEFNLNRFYKEFGIGTGFGLRFDFSFLILRLDVGIKAWDPARPEGQRFILANTRFIGPYGIDSEPVIYNIGIGYPF